MANEAAELWDEYDNVAYFVGDGVGSPQEEARMVELRQLILANERRATVERIRAALDANPWYAKAPRSQLNAILDEEAK